MNYLIKTVFACALVVNAFVTTAQKNKAVHVWLTKGDSTILFRQQRNLSFSNTGTRAKTVIRVDPAKTYQTIEGFGFALTQGSAMHMIHMSPAKRAALIRELFDSTGNNIGITYIRLSIGASDLNENVFSYDDMPEGQTDTSLSKFDLGPDRKDVIPVMKEILAVNPHIKIMGSPWSPPAWMKTNHDTRGGRLKPEYYPAYAKYLLKYIVEMKKEGIVIDAITIQNEPLHPGNNPSLLMTAPEQATFIKDHLGPLFEANAIKTRIIIYDHNADRPDYPIYILNDSAARKYVDGSGFHLYGGHIEALTDVHNAHPDKHIYFTEQMVVQFGDGRETYKLNIAEPVAQLFIGATRNWSRNVLEWNLASNPQLTPYTDRGGCSICQGAITIDGDSVTRNLAWYAMAHASKCIRPGALRIGSNEPGHLPNVAFKSPDDKVVLLVANTSGSLQSFTIRYGRNTVTTSLAPGSVATYWWEK